MPNPSPKNRLPKSHLNSRVAARPASAGSRARDGADQRVLVGVVVLFIITAIGLMSWSVSSGVHDDETRAAMTGTFRSVHVQQQLFRTLNARFATWPELAATGATLPPSQSINASRADGSHWFLSLVDREAGLICDRTGELLDQRPDERQPVCRKTEN